MLCWRSPFSFSSARWVSNFQANIITLFMLTFLSITCSSTRFSADKFRLIVISKCLRAIGHLLNKIPRENNNYCSLKWDICINVIRILEPACWFHGFVIMIIIIWKFEDRFPYNCMLFVTISLVVFISQLKSLLRYTIRLSKKWN